MRNKLTLITSTLLALSFAFTSPANARDYDHGQSHGSQHKSKHNVHQKPIRYVQHNHYKYIKPRPQHRPNPPATIIKIDTRGPFLGLLFSSGGAFHHRQH